MGFNCRLKPFRKFFRFGDPSLRRVLRYIHPIIALKQYIAERRDGIESRIKRFADAEIFTPKQICRSNILISREGGNYTQNGWLVLTVLISIHSCSVKKND